MLCAQSALQHEARTKGFIFLHFLRYVYYNLQSFKQEQKMVTIYGRGVYERDSTIEVFTVAR